jgi:RNA polymerase sigma factor (sigma-70 family)
LSSDQRGDPPLRSGSEEGPHPGWEDSRLVGGCLRGDQAAWHALVEKFSRLVYAVILRYGVGPDDVSDLFQTVWINVYSDLEKIRKQDSLSSWLITVTRRRCYHWRQDQQRRHRLLQEARNETVDGTVGPLEMEVLESDQRVREAVFSLPERCREMIGMLFYADPPVPYQDVASRLGLAVGSIGFIRGRCLQKLQKLLESEGLV